ncbi:MAG: hypothetical protein P8Y36_01320, partial [Alphaproteobacteria bacterium]
CLVVALPRVCRKKISGPGRAGGRLHGTAKKEGLTQIYATGTLTGERLARCHDGRMTATGAAAGGT